MIVVLSNVLVLLLGYASFPFECFTAIIEMA